MTNVTRPRFEMSWSGSADTAMMSANLTARMLPMAHPTFHRAGVVRQASELYSTPGRRHASQRSSLLLHAEAVLSTDCVDDVPL